MAPDGTGPAPVVFRHHGLLGTVVELRLTFAASVDDTSAVDTDPEPAPVDEARLDALAEAADAALVAEIERLQALLSARDEDSELRRWCRGETAAGPEVAAVVALAAAWQARSGGAFDPRAGLLVDRWSAAEAADREPTDADVDAWVAELRALPLDRPGAPLDLSALAKGWIVDRVADLAATRPELVAVTVNAGGDLCHRGAGSVLVGIEDPARPYDNVPPLTTVRLADRALATSGVARRAWIIDGRRHPHTLDPRTARPVGHVASVSVLAPDTATADVVATVLTVLDPDEGLAFVADLAGDPLAGDTATGGPVACLLVGADGRRHRSPGWPDDADP